MMAWEPNVAGKQLARPCLKRPDPSEWSAVLVLGLTFKENCPDLPQYPRCRCCARVAGLQFRLMCTIRWTNSGRRAPMNTGGLFLGETPPPFFKKKKKNPPKKSRKIAVHGSFWPSRMKACSKRWVRARSAVLAKLIRIFDLKNVFDKKEAIWLMNDMAVQLLKWNRRPVLGSSTG